MKQDQTKSTRCKDPVEGIALLSVGITLVIRQILVFEERLLANSLDKTSKNLISFSNEKEEIC